MTITPKYFSPIDWDTFTLAKGSHSDDQDVSCGQTPEACLWEAINLARTGHLTDTCPADTSQTLHAYTIRLNDALPIDRRQQLKAYRDRLVGTAGQPGADKRAAYMCVDWLIRTYTPAWLRLAGLNEHADALAFAPEVTDLITLAGVTDHISAAGSAAKSAAHSAAYSAAHSAAHSAAYSAAESAAYSAADSAAALAAASAADSAAALAAYSAAYSAADSAAALAAYSAAALAADSAAASALAPTVTLLQDSVIALLDRMLTCYTTGATA